MQGLGSGQDAGVVQCLRRLVYGLRQTPGPDRQQPALTPARLAAELVQICQELHGSAGELGTLQPQQRHPGLATALHQGRRDPAGEGMAGIDDPAEWLLPCPGPSQLLPDAGQGRGSGIAGTDRAHHQLQARLRRIGPGGRPADHTHTQLPARLQQGRCQLGPLAGASDQPQPGCLWSGRASALVKRERVHQDGNCRRRVGA